MGESYLSGVEFKDSGQKEGVLLAALQHLVGKPLRLVLKTDEITTLADCFVTPKAVVRREDRIEAGHLTLDHVYFDLVNDQQVKLYFPLVQFQAVTDYGDSRLFQFDTYAWTATIRA
ncbi:MAG TPA: hypothetical protein VHQ46_00280 [Desulfobacteria bacterium]|nr:hypothetical protein [Desulfobacteria bacterium]